MKRMLPLLLLFYLAFLGCGQKSLPNTFQGKSLRYWEAMAASQNPELRRNAAKALGEIGPNGVPALILLYQDRDDRVRTSALMALLEVGGPKAVPQIIPFLHDPDPKIRFGAVKAIQAFGKEAKDAIPALKELLHDESRSVRQAATAALLIFGIKPPASKAPGSPSSKK
jgi:HEAT repeat protein